MKAKLSNYVKRKRLEQGLNTPQLAKKMGYRNINKGMRRIVELEREGKVHLGVLEKIIKVLELDMDKVDQLIKEDKEQQRREFEEWVNTPIGWHLIIRWMPAVYGEREIPGHIKIKDEAVEYAKSVAIEHKSIVWLVLSREVNIHIDSDGNIKMRYEVTIEYSWLPRTRIK